MFNERFSRSLYQLLTVTEEETFSRSTINQGTFQLKHNDITYSVSFYKLFSLLRESSCINILESESLSGYTCFGATSKSLDSIPFSFSYTSFLHSIRSSLSQSNIVWDLEQLVDLFYTSFFNALSNNLNHVTDTSDLCFCIDPNASFVTYSLKNHWNVRYIWITRKNRISVYPSLFYRSFPLHYQQPLILRLLNYFLFIATPISSPSRSVDIQMSNLAQLYPHQILHIYLEDLVHTTAECLEQLRGFLGLSQLTKLVPVQPSIFKDAAPQYGESFTHIKDTLEECRVALKVTAHIKSALYHAHPVQLWITTLLMKPTRVLIWLLR